MRIKVGVIFGGETVEHEVSIITAIQAMNKMDQDKYEIIVFHNDFYDIIDAYNLPKTTDSSIIATAYQFYKNV